MVNRGQNRENVTEAVQNTGTIFLESCKSSKQTQACVLVCLPDLQSSRKIFPVFSTKGGLICIYTETHIETHHLLKCLFLRK